MQMTYSAWKIPIQQLMEFVSAAAVVADAVLEVAVVHFAALKIVVAVTVHMDRRLHIYYKQEELTHLKQGHHLERTASCTYYIGSEHLQAESMKKMLVAVRYRLHFSCDHISFEVLGPRLKCENHLQKSTINI